MSQARHQSQCILGAGVRLGRRLGAVGIGLCIAGPILVASAATAKLGLPGWLAFSWIVDGAPRYGTAVALGDLNGDGRMDLAVGMPAYDDGALPNSGAVAVHLSSGDSSYLTTVISSCEANGDLGSGFQFGTSLAFGHFDSDQFADLAVGMPFSTVGPVSAGAVCIIYGGASEPYARARFDTTFLQGSAEDGDRFGQVLAAGDLTGDGMDELVVGSPGKDVNNSRGAVSVDAGAFHVIVATPGGLATADNIYEHQGLISAYDIEPGTDDLFGSSLVVGDFWQSELYPDQELAVGAPGEQGSGSVFVFGSQTGLLAQLSPPIYDGPHWDLLGTAEPGDEFGAALAAADFNGDGLIDLAVGAPGDDDLSVATEAGSVTVLYGEGNSLSDVGQQVLYESVIDGGGAGTGSFDRFGEVLAAGDFNNDGHGDLAVGAPLDNSLGVGNSGEVTVLYGGTLGLQVTGLQIFDMIFFSGLEPGDEFGAALAAAPLSNGRGDSLLVGSPGRTHTTGGGALWADTGQAILIHSASLFADGFESGDTSAWN